MDMNTMHNQIVTQGYGHFKVSYLHPARRQGMPVQTGKGSTRRWDKAKAERSGRTAKVVWHTA